MLKTSFCTYKNIHKNKDCFILATGPSINQTSLCGLENKITFGCNTFYKHDFKTNYFCVCDEMVWENHRENILRKYDDVFSCFEGRSKFRLLDSWLEDNLANYGDIVKGIYRSHTVVGCMLQICYWMGFDKVYLIGCDCTYKENKHHFDGSSVDNFKRENWDEVFDQYEIAKKIYEINNRRIYNCTVGGNLEVFQRKRLEDVI